MNFGEYWPDYAYGVLPMNIELMHIACGLCIAHERRLVCTWMQYHCVLHGIWIDTSWSWRKVGTFCMWIKDECVFARNYDWYVLHEIHTGAYCTWIKDGAYCTEIKDMCIVHEIQIGTYCTEFKFVCITLNSGWRVFHMNKGWCEINMNNAYVHIARNLNWYV